MLDNFKKIYTANKLFGILSITIFCLSSCNSSNSDHRVSFKAINDGVITKVTNIYSDKYKISKVVYDNSKVLDAPSMAIDNDESISQVVITDDKNNSYSIWVFNGKNWNKITDGANSPKPIVEVFGKLKPDSIVVSTSIGKSLWVYNGKVWTSMLGGKNQPQSIKKIVNDPTATFIVILDKDDKIWEYANNQWSRLSDIANYPNDISEVYTDKNFLAVTDKKSILWLYNKKHWINTNLVIDNIYGHKSTDFLVIKDKNSALYLYRGKSRVKVTGLQNAPENVDNVYDYPTPNSLIMKDNKANLWSYNGKSWKMLTNPNIEPKSVARVFGHPTMSSIVIEDNDNHNLWVYDGKDWSRQTGGVNQPSNVDLMFMAHQIELQQ